MPACFQLAHKDNPAEPLKLSLVDEEICKQFNVPVHEIRYYNGWYDTIGFKLAMGKSWTEIREDLNRWNAEDKAKGFETSFNERMLEILSFMEEQYTQNCWYEVGRRS